VSSAALGAAVVLGAVGALVVAGLSAGAPEVQVGGSVHLGSPNLKKTVQVIVGRIKRVNLGNAGAAPVPKQPHAGGHWVTILDATALALIVAGVVYFFIIPALRRVDWSRLTKVADLPEPEDAESAILTPEALERLRADLSETAELLDEDGDPRHAVLACWLRLEDAVGRTGLARSRWETSAEFTTRVLRTYTVDPSRLEALHGLYRAARYSTSEVAPSARDAARAALQGLRAEIERPVELAAAP
jgi:hypothetical protein